jgi:hypothetical protein
MAITLSSADSSAISDVQATTVIIRQQPAPSHARQIDWYTWLAFIALCDFVCTSVVLHLGGAEINPLAALVLDQSGLGGMFIYRVLVVVTVLMLCEWLWLRRATYARFAVLTSLMVSIPPVVFAVVQLGNHFLR